MEESNFNKQMFQYNVSTLCITERALEKIKFLRSLGGGNEVACMGVLVEDSAADPRGRDLTVNDIYIPKQISKHSTVEMTDEGLQEMGLEMVQKEIPPRRYMRVWIHTHPFNSANPSGVDWATFDEIYRESSFGLMAILADNNEISCHISIKVGTMRIVAPLAVCIVKAPVLSGEDRDEITSIFMAKVQTTKPEEPKELWQIQHTIQRFPGGMVGNTIPLSDYPPVAEKISRKRNKRKRREMLRKLRVKK